jgi:hypothetical protein
MKHTTQNEAQARAERVRDKFKLKGWAVRVWENLGWHWNLQRANLSLSEYPKGRDGKTYFSCMVSDDPEKPGSGLAVWSPDDRGFPETPQEAIFTAVNAASKYADEISKAAIAANAAVLATFKEGGAS